MENHSNCSQGETGLTWVHEPAVAQGRDRNTKLHLNFSNSMNRFIEIQFLSQNRMQRLRLATPKSRPSGYFFFSFPKMRRVRVRVGTLSVWPQQ